MQELRDFGLHKRVTDGIGHDWAALPLIVAQVGPCSIISRSMTNASEAASYSR